MFNPLHSSTNRELLEKHFYNPSSHYEKCRQFLFRRKPSCATTKATLFTACKDESEHKGIIEYHDMPKGIFQAEATCNEKSSL